MLGKHNHSRARPCRIVGRARRVGGTKLAEQFGYASLSKVALMQEEEEWCGGWGTHHAIRQPLERWRAHRVRNLTREPSDGRWETERFDCLHNALVAGHVERQWGASMGGLHRNHRLGNILGAAAAQNQ